MFFIKMIGAVIALALCPLWGISAQIPEGTALLSPPAGNREEEFHYSSLSVYEEPGQSHSSTLFFNDGFGRLTIFEMEYHDGLMTVIIRRNMNILWKDTFSVKSPSFSVKRHDLRGKITFEITAGEHILYGEIDKNDRWDMKEKGKKRQEETPFSPYLPAGNRGSSDSSVSTV